MARLRSCTRTVAILGTASMLQLAGQFLFDVAGATTVTWADRSSTWAPATASYYPCAGDLDADGDMDLVVFDPLGVLENTGPGSYPTWSVREDWAASIEVPEGYIFGADLGDLDGDGDSDLLVLVYNVGIVYLENTGTPAAPSWVRDDEYFFYPVNAVPSIVDLDSDGDADIALGSWSLGCIWNEGSGTSPVWVEDWSAFHGIDPYGAYIDLCFGDLDGDGDLDLVTAPAAGTGRLQAYEDVGAGFPADWLFNLDLISGIPQFEDMKGAFLADLSADKRPDFLTLRVFVSSCYANEGADTTAVTSDTWGEIKARFWGECGPLTGAWSRGAFPHRGLPW